MAVSTYTLSINDDGSQNTAYAAGDKPGALVAPTNLIASNETTSSVDLSWDYTGTGQTGQIIDQWVSGASSWSQVAEVSATARFWQAQGLPGKTQVGHRVRAKSADVLSAWSQEAWTTTLLNVDDGPILSDDFSGYAVGTSLNNITPPVAAAGVKWTSARGDSGGSPIIVAGGYGGDANALGFRFNPQPDGDCWSEQRFNLCATAETALTEVWVEYYVYWPADFELGDDGGLSNNKGLFIYSSQFGMILDDHYAGDFWASMGWWPRDSANEEMVMTQSVSVGRDGVRDNWGGAAYSYGSPPWSSHNFQGSNSFNPIDTGTLAFWDKSLDNGNWRKYQFHLRKATGRAEYNASLRVWKDGTKIVEIKDSDFCDDTVKGFDSGYLFGWFNTGVAHSTVVKISRCKMYANNPGWTVS